MLLRTGGGGGARHNNFPFEAHFSAPPSPDNYCTVPQLKFTVGLATHVWPLYFILSQLFSVFIIKDCGRKGTERLWECARQKNTPSLGENLPYVLSNVGQSQFQNPGNFCFRNHQSWALWSVIQLRSQRIHVPLILQVIRNPEHGIQNLQYGIQNQRLCFIILHRTTCLFPRGGGGGTLVNVCWVCAAGLSEPLPSYSLFCGQL